MSRPDRDRLRHAYKRGEKTATTRRIDICGCVKPRIWPLKVRTLLLVSTGGSFNPNQSPPSALTRTRIRRSHMELPGPGALIERAGFFRVSHVSTMRQLDLCRVNRRSRIGPVKRDRHGFRRSGRSDTSAVVLTRKPAHVPRYWLRRAPQNPPGSPVTRSGTAARSIEASGLARPISAPPSLGRRWADHVLIAARRAQVSDRECVARTHRSRASCSGAACA